MALGRKTKWLLLTLSGVAVLGLAGFGVWLSTLPIRPSTSPVAPVSAAETSNTLASLQSTRRERPVVAIVGINDATETTDYLMPYGILRRADVADVFALATESGPVRLYPALTVVPDATISEFDTRYPEGADFVIVPAMSRDDDPGLLRWLRSQADRGAIVIGVCAGAKIVGEAGLLSGKRATTHWYYRDEMLNNDRSIRYVANRRFVTDDKIATTTGISASMPAMLTLIEAIGGRAKAEATARSLGVHGWDARHDSAEFLLTRPFALTVMQNTLSFWNREEVGVALRPGIDEVSLALTADAWSRTYRSRAFSYAASRAPQTTANGLRVIPDQVSSNWPPSAPSVALGAETPVAALESALRSIRSRYGADTAYVVTMQLEYPTDEWSH